MSSGALPQTLRSITATKIGELSKQRALFDQRKTEIANAAAAAPDLRTKAQVLLEGVTKLKGHPNDAFDKEQLDATETDLSTLMIDDGSERAAHINIRRFLLQGQYDPSVSDWALQDWISELEQEIQHLVLKHQHASFYSGLVTEWLANLDETTSEEPEAGNTGRSEMHEQRATWEGYVFNKTNVDAGHIHSYLDDLFTKTPLTQQALKQLRESISRFGWDLSGRKKWFTADVLKTVTEALLKSDLLTKDKTIILKEFMRNPAVTQEVVDVLNMRLAALDSWDWPAGEAIPLEMRRQLNGKYRVYMDEDLLDSIMFQFLGLEWSVKFREVFSTFRDSQAWYTLREHISEREKNRRRYYSIDQTKNYITKSVNDHRQKTYKDQYFMTQLPTSMESGVPDYEGEESVDSAGRETQRNPLETKHSLLHLLVTESIIQSTLHGQFTAIRSDFKYFGPSLPHETILTVLSYFGVPDNWIRFFKIFLEMPMKFVQDGPNATTRVRKRGVPMSHALSDFFGEVVLFCMDYTVNRHTDGAFLYRLHDDFWFWGNEATCVKAWKAMSDFANTVGLEFNEEKTGTVQITNDNSQAPPGTFSKEQKTVDADTVLPAGDIRWGFLKLDAQQGRFIIDQGQVDNHIAELKHQLSSCKSIFAWVQAWNSYFARFFPNNFAKPAVCFGRDHIDMAISALGRIERAVVESFTGSPSGVTDYLRKVIADRFGVHELPEGFFYFPVELGGLELANPYIPLLAMREDIKQTPQGRLQRVFIEDETKYNAAKKRFEESGPNTSVVGSIYDNSDDEEARPRSSSTDFPTLDEYRRHPETYSAPLLNAYEDLTRIPEETSIKQSPNFRGTQSSLQQKLVDDDNVKISGEWDDMSAYWRWTAELYHREVVARYGGLAAVNREFMPLGVIKTLKEGRMRWEN